MLSGWRDNTHRCSLWCTFCLDGPFCFICDKTLRGLVLTIFGVVIPEEAGYVIHGNTREVPERLNLDQQLSLSIRSIIQGLPSLAGK